jgi:hypothetical protein
MKILNKRFYTTIFVHLFSLILNSKTRNISQTSSSSESKLDEDYNSSDVFYQKGVSFSAKLDDTETYETNLSSSIVDTLPDNQPRDLTSFESKIEPNNESSFVLSTNNNNIINNNNNDNKNNNNFNIPRFHQTSHLAFHPLKGKLKEPQYLRALEKSKRR